MPPIPAQKNCDHGCSRLGSSCPSNRATNRLTPCVAISEAGGHVLERGLYLIGTELDRRLRHDLHNVEPVALAH